MQLSQARSRKWFSVFKMITEDFPSLNALHTAIYSGFKKDFFFFKVIYISGGGNTDKRVGPCF